MAQSPAVVHTAPAVGDLGRRGRVTYRTGPEQSDAREEKMREGMQTPGWLGSASGFPARKDGSNYLGGWGATAKGTLT